MTGFPLFRLPLLPLKDVLDNMHEVDSTMLYLCSEKTQNVMNVTKKSVSIKSLSNKQKENLTVMEKITLLRQEIQKNPCGSIGCFPNDCINITIKITNKPEIIIDKDDNPENRYQECFPIYIDVIPIEEEILYPQTGKTIRIDNINVPVKMMDNNKMITYWKDSYNGLNTFVNYFKRFFNSQAIDYVLEGSNNWEFSRNLRAVVKELSQQTIAKCVLTKLYNNCENYKFIFNNINPTVCFEHVNHLKSQKGDFRYKSSIISRCFIQKTATWFTFHNLITTDFENIQLFESRFTNADIVEYAKLWMTGSFQNLKCLTVELRELVDLDIIFSKLQSYSEKLTLAFKFGKIFIRRQDETTYAIISYEGRSERVLKFDISVIIKLKTIFLDN